MASYDYPVYDYRPSADQRGRQPARRKVVIVGAGPVGLTAAIDLAARGVETVVLDEDNTVSAGSRAICHAKRTLEIWDRLGCAEAMVAKGVTWRTGKVFFGDRQVYAFDLLPEGGHHFPAFINLQQYYAEQFLVERAMSMPEIDLRWKNRVTGVEPRNDCVRLAIETPDGPYALEAEWLIAADGARSPTRKQLGLDFRGKVFEDRFLIADVKMKADLPTERRFWFEPPFHPGGSALLHRQADDVWRIDLQIGWNAAPEEEKKPERVIPRLRAMLGPEARFDLEWVSVYTFQCRRLDRFRHGRIIFAGDAAHQVSPFGARGGNSGVQDADNLGWKLALVAKGLAPDALIDSYAAEREAAADENIRHSTRSTDFITPKGAASRLFRDAALSLAAAHPFARRLVNSGRLSTASVMTGSPLNTPDRDDFAGVVPPGAAAIDAPVVRDGKSDWLLHALGEGFAGLWFLDAPPPRAEAETLAVLGRKPIPMRTAIVSRKAFSSSAGLPVLVDTEGLAAARYDARPGTFYLFRPDQHACARWRGVDPAAIETSIARAIAHSAY
ncbi:MAG: FAD-dependent oxidoreductase [Rhodospirillales bacterium]|nr:FAD-dependent oxidoreductase [Rhodospirillales bacterium]